MAATSSALRPVPLGVAFAGPAGVGTVDDDAGRVAALGRVARWVVAGRPPDPDPDLADAVINALTDIQFRTAEALGASTSSEHLAASQEMLREIARIQRELRDHALGLRGRSAGAIEASLERLRAAGSADAVLGAACDELNAACSLDRAVLSRVQGSICSLMSLRVSPSTSGGPERDKLQRILGDTTFRMTSGLIETEAVRRRRAIVVGDSRACATVFAPIIAAARCRSFLVAPVVVGNVVVGLLHADTFATRRRLTEHDRLALTAFADGLGQVYEAAVLRGRAEAGAERLAAHFAQSARRMLALNDESTPPYARGSGPERPVPTHLGSRLATLTPREREILVALSHGATNREIARDFVIQPSTVKSHLFRILRKLQARTRTEAIAIFMREMRADVRRT